RDKLVTGVQTCALPICDLLTGIASEQLAKMQKGVTKALINSALVMPAGFTRNPDLAFPRGSMEREIEDAVAPGDAEFLDATKLRSEERRVGKECRPRGG